MHDIDLKEVVRKINREAINRLKVIIPPPRPRSAFKKDLPQRAIIPEWKPILISKTSPEIELDILLPDTDEIYSAKIIVSKLYLDHGAESLAETCISILKDQSLNKIEKDHSLNEAITEWQTKSKEEVSRITMLNLSKSGITSIPPCIRGFTNLKLLILNDNNLTVLPSLKGLVNLRAIDISFNEFTEIPNVDGLSDLMHLDISNNPLSNPARNVLNIPSNVALKL